MTKIVVIIILFVLVMISVNVYKYVMNSKGFKEMQEVFFADGACSDNLQLSMFTFNRAMTTVYLMEKVVNEDGDRKELERQLKEHDY